MKTAMKKKTAWVVAIGPHALPVAQIAADAIGARLLTSPHHLPEAVQAFRKGTAIIGVMAAGILMRHFAPHLTDKTKDAPLILLDPHGDYILPLTGAHHGAMAWIQKIAPHLHKAKILSTTASKNILGFSLSEPPAGWHLIAHKDYASLTARILEGASVRISPALTWLGDLKQTPSHEAISLIASWRKKKELHNCLIYAPQRLAVGIGCIRHIDSKFLIQKMDELLAHHQLEPQAISGFFSLDIKKDEDAIHHCANHYQREARFFSKDELEQEKMRLRNPSTKVFKEVGIYGVAEAAALRAVGKRGKLIVPKTSYEGLNLAIALAPKPMIELNGNRRGSLTIIGIGAGGGETMTMRAHRHLWQAECIVGFEGYLNLLTEFKETHRMFPYPLGAEEERAQKAFLLAEQGYRVALVSSGDAGIYGMAAPAIQLLKDAPPSWHRIQLKIVAGVSAMQEASARHGAALGHDIATISLSDLLTPRDIILNRLQSALIAEFVIALYNPTSSKRQEFFKQCLTLIYRHRKPQTPILIARLMERKGDHSTITTLDELPLLEKDIDMNTIIIIGTATSQLIEREHHDPLMLTPRNLKEHLS